MAKTVYGLGSFQSGALKGNDELKFRVTNLESNMLSARVSSIGPDGVVVAEVLGQNANQLGVNTIIAYPLLGNIKSYPLINEAILIFKSISKIKRWVW